MASRRRAALTTRKSGSAGARTARPPQTPRAAKARLYTAQDVARFCEVDLKTIHHWADGGKIPHHRTEGRHLRFRRNHVVGFLRSHGYPLHDELVSARPSVFYAGSGTFDALDEEIARKLSNRFFVTMFDCAALAIAHLVAKEPDALVLSLDDLTWTGAPSIRALKANASTAWTKLVVVTSDANGRDARSAEEAGADLVIDAPDVARLTNELARALGVDTRARSDA